MTPIGRPGTDEDRVAAKLQGIAHPDIFGPLTETLQLFAASVPARTSVRQLLAFAITLQANSQGDHATMADIRDVAGEDIGQSIAKTYATYLAPDKHMPDALGWVEQESDEDDRRRKFLRLTKEGREIAQRVAQIWDRR